jgi:DNA-binding transcriptional MerR regulator
MYKIKQFSTMVGVSIRMLRHYDKIGLLIPEYINQENGYRYYGDKNLALMQQVLFFKELDFSLKEIKEILNDASFNQKDALSMQKNLLQLKKQRLSAMVNFIDELLNNKQKGAQEMSNKLKQAINTDAFQKQKLAYAQEAKQKWGHTDRYKQSQRKAAQYSKQEIAEINAKQEQIYQDLAGLMPLGTTDKKVQQKVHEARMFINDHWYECSKQQFAGLGQMYINDPRFKTNIDKHGEGFAVFLNQAIGEYVSNNDN